MDQLFHFFESQSGFRRFTHGMCGREHNANRFTNWNPDVRTTRSILARVKALPFGL
jgi:hypothetical protein